MNAHTGVTTPAPDTPKEVAPMESTKNMMTVMIPSSFGASACGHAFGTTTASTAVPFVGTGAFGTVVRDRAVVAKEDMGLAIAYVPGTLAWSSPPS
jgi:hypothetical protein